MTVIGTFRREQRAYQRGSAERRGPAVISCQIKRSRRSTKSFNCARARRHVHRSNPKVKEEIHTVQPESRKSEEKPVVT